MAKYKGKPVVQVVFTPGFGNNLFQYTFARLLAKVNHARLSHGSLKGLGIKARTHTLNHRLRIRKIDKILDGDKSYGKYLSEPRKNPCNFVVRTGYFEDYRLYADHLDTIRSWFKDIPKTNHDDLVVHIRLGNRLVQATSHQAFLTVEQYKEAFSHFDFKRLHVVTDSKVWKPITKNYVKQLRRSIKRPNTKFVRISQSIDYMNSLVEGFKEFDPVIHHHPKFISDFNVIRSFNQIVVHNSTFAWWAAVLSHAEQVGVYRPWKPYKGKRNKNLGETNYAGWFGWGDA